MKSKSLFGSLVLLLIPAALMAESDQRTHWWKGGLGPDGQTREGNFGSLSPREDSASPVIGENDDLRSLVGRAYGVPFQESDGRAITRYDLTLRRLQRAITDFHAALAASEEYTFGTDKNTTFSFADMKHGDSLPAGQRVFLPSPQALDDLLSGSIAVEDLVTRELERVDTRNALVGLGRSTGFATGPLGADYPADEEDPMSRPVTLLGITMARAMAPDGTTAPPHASAEEALAVASQTGLTRAGANSALLYDFLVERWRSQLGVTAPADSVELGRSAGNMGFDM